MLRYTGCNIVIVMAANCVADVVLQFLYRAWIWFVYRTFQISPPSPRNFLWGHLSSTVYKSNPHTIQELKYNISHAVAAITITMLHRAYLNMIRRAQLCIDAGGSHFQHLLWWYILSAFGYCINFCIYAMLWTRATFRGPPCVSAFGAVNDNKLEKSRIQIYKLYHCSQLTGHVTVPSVNLHTHTTHKNTPHTHTHAPHTHTPHTHTRTTHTHTHTTHTHTTQKHTTRTHTPHTNTPHTHTHTHTHHTHTHHTHTHPHTSTGRHASNFTAF